MAPGTVILVQSPITSIFLQVRDRAEELEDEVHALKVWPQYVKHKVMIHV